VFQGERILFWVPAYHFWIALMIVLMDLMVKTDYHMPFYFVKSPCIQLCTLICSKKYVPTFAHDTRGKFYYIRIYVYTTAFHIFCRFSVFQQKWLAWLV